MDFKRSIQACLAQMLHIDPTHELSAGVDLSKILRGGNQNFRKGQQVAVNDEILGVSQLLEGTSAPQVQACIIIA